MNKPTIESTSKVAVHGAAQLQVDPDYAWLQLMVLATKADREAVLDEISKSVDAVNARLDGLPGVRLVRFSRVRVYRDRYWDEKKNKYRQGMWVASVRGSTEVDVDAVASVVTAAVAGGAQVSGVGWHLDADNAAYREVRKLAVDDAHRAARDFADAVGVQLGALVSLADPGLLAAASHYDRPETYADMAPRALRSDASYEPEAPVEIDLNPEPQFVYARVEGSYRLVA